MSNGNRVCRRAIQGSGSNGRGRGFVSHVISVVGRLHIVDIRVSYYSQHFALRDLCRNDLRDNNFVVRRFCYRFLSLSTSPLYNLHQRSRTKNYQKRNGFGHLWLDQESWLMTDINQNRPNRVANAIGRTLVEKELSKEHLSHLSPAECWFWYWRLRERSIDKLETDLTSFILSVCREFTLVTQMKFWVSIDTRSLASWDTFENRSGSASTKKVDRQADCHD